MSAYIRDRLGFLRIAVLVVALFSSGCLPKTSVQSGGITITLYGFSIMKEPLEKAIYPAFTAKWKAEHGQDVHFVSSFAGSETVTNQILQGVKADMAILSIDRDAKRLMQGGFVTTDWHNYPFKGIVNKTPFVILVRKGNPKGIHDFPDLARPGIKVIHPDPVSSGGAQWSLLAIYGSELKKSEARSGTADKAKALQMLKGIWKNVISTPGSAREARTQFETGSGDALITYELEGLSMKAAGGNVDLVIPEATIFSEHPVAIIDKNVPAANRPLVDAFVQYLWSDEAQRDFVKFHFRSVTKEEFNQENSDLATIKLPFDVDYFGGWDKAYPDVIEGIFKKQVQQSK
ncbi:MAG: sulfate/thiosulfate transport system substrate-binding protein [Blastocatellia bacterium]|jgi:sulfate transport system substrate-binding protein|nr:sulfate/thiosulfate transport system substrate-binding protein [Blastocatellia bacterium]